MKKLIFFGLVSFLLAAIWLVPLAYVTPYIQKAAPNLKLQEASGTIWNGQVNQLSINNHYLGKANWKVDLLESIKSFSLKSKFNLKSEDITAYGVAGITPSKQIRINNTQFDVNAEYLNTLQKNAQLTGSFNGFIKHAKIIKSEIPIIDAIVNWQNGALNTPIKLTEGDYRAEIKPVDQDLVINLSSKEAPIELNGDIKLQKDWKYITNLSTKSNNAGLTAMLKFAGKKQADDSILIQQQGDLKPLIGLK